MKVGIQISSVRKFLDNERNVKESFEKVKKIGYNDIQIQWISPDVSSEFIKNVLDSTQLDCIGTQDLYDEVAPNIDDIIEMNELWGGKYICFSRIPERFHSPDGCLSYASEINKLSNQVERSGKILTFHPVASDFTRYGDKTLVDILIENCTDKLQIVLDIFHVFRAGCDPVEWIRKLHGRIPMVHFKDVTIQNENEILVPVGQGIIDWDKIIGACIETGIGYCFAEQEQWQKDPFDCLRESYEYIVSKINKNPPAKPGVFHRRA